MKKLVQFAIVIFLAVVVMFGGRWYMYVAFGESPYDEVGIALNGYMPLPLRSWGCHKIQSRFEGKLPPYGCSGPDGRSWL
ncbi:hypothetical protein E5176_28400 [Ensifer adhaerens]|nr:hypothetical protein E5176_28400 [Ensifer adhaerens]